MGLLSSGMMAKPPQFEGPISVEAACQLQRQRRVSLEAMHRVATGADPTLMHYASQMLLASSVALREPDTGKSFWDCYQRN